MVTLVEQMPELHKRQAACKSQSDRDLYQRQTARPAVSGVDATDCETACPAVTGIDWLVYELYGLTEEEIKIVEGE